MRNLVWAALLLPVLSSAARNQAGSDEFSFELAFDPLEIPYYDDLAVTADGKRIAYTVRRKPVDAEMEREYDPLATPGFYLGAKIQLAQRATRGGKVTTRTLCENAGNSWAGSWSHDGSKIAFYADAGGKPGVWIYDSKTCRALGTTLTGGMLGAAPVWSRDDRKLYVTTPEIKSAADTEKLTAPTAESKATVKLLSAGGEAGTDDQRQPLLWGPSRYSIAEVDVASGESRIFVAASADPSPAAMRLSKSGRWLSYLSSTLQDGPAGEFRKDLAVVSMPDGAIKKVVTGLPEMWGAGSRLAYSWHPDRDQLVYWKDGGVWLVEVGADGPGAPKQLVPELGRLESTLYWFTRDGRLIVGTNPIHPTRNGRFDVSPRGLAIVPLDGGQVRRVTLDTSAEFISLVKVDESTVWQPDSCCITLQQRDKETGERSVVRFDIESGRREVLWHGYAQLADNVATTPDHRELFSVHQDLQTAENISLFSATFTRQRLVSIDPRLDDVKVGVAETFKTTVPGYAAALDSVRTTVLLPAGAKRGDRLPAVVMIYPGSDLSNRNEEFGGGMGNTIPSLLFTSRGFAVVMAHVKLGPERVPNDIAKQMVDSLLPQLYRAAELGYIDIERLALSGQSYGGYSTALIASQTNLFRAGITVNGVFDIAGSYSAIDKDGASINIGWAEQSQGRMGQHPWANLSRYIENSPYYRADRIYTPLLILSGEGDQRVPSEESKRLFTALRRLDRPAQLALYAGQGHVVFEWTQANAVDASERVVAFLRKHLLSR